MYDILKSTKFKKAYKKVMSYPKFKKKDFEEVLTKLQNQEPLDSRYDDHKAAKHSPGELKTMRILHLSPNICLIYKVLDDEKAIYLYDLGSHQDTGLTEDYSA